MNRDIAALREAANITEAIRTMIETSSEFVVVVSENMQPVGVVWMLEAIRSMLSEPEITEETSVTEIMSTQFTLVTKEDSEQTVLRGICRDMLPVIVVDQGVFQKALSTWELLDAQQHFSDYMEHLLDNIDEGIMAIDDHLNITYMNKMYRQIHSIEDNDLIGKSVLDSFPESKLAEINASNDCIVVDEPLHLDFSGATVLPYYKAVMGKDENCLGAAAIVKDYNKTNNLYIGVNKLNGSNDIIGLIYDNLKEAVFIVNDKMEIHYSNKKFNEISLNREQDILKEPEIRRLLTDQFHTGKLDVFNEYVELPENRSFSVVGIPLRRINQPPESMIVILQDITKLQILRNEIKKKKGLLDYYKSQINKIPNEMICESECFKEVVSIALKAADSDANIIIEGENGVGKELIANLVHSNSQRSKSPFIPVNCGAIPDSLWESEMFGYEGGAFTGANQKGKIGIFEMGDGGTVFLDEISEVSLAGQVKMLRFLQNMEIAKIGRKETKKIDVRIIAATNKNLEEMVAEGAFREDLYYRLNVVKLNVPPLRERREEIRPLTMKFLETFNKRYKKTLDISLEAIKLLTDYSWPGNIRQLRNVIEQSVIMCDRIIQTYDLLIDNTEDNMKKVEQHKQAKGIFNEEEVCNLPLRVKALERELILEALKRCDNNKSQAIKMLHIGRKTFYSKLKEYELML